MNVRNLMDESSVAREGTGATVVLSFKKGDRENLGGTVLKKRKILIIRKQIGKFYK